MNDGIELEEKWVEEEVSMKEHTVAASLTPQERCDARNAGISAAHVWTFNVNPYPVEVAYLSGDGLKLTTWTGETLARVTREWTRQMSGFAGHRKGTPALRDLPSRRVGLQMYHSAVGDRYARRPRREAPRHGRDMTNDDEKLCERCKVPEDALSRLTALSPTIEGFTVRDRWMSALFFAEHLKRELDRVEQRNAVLEQRIKLLVEVGQGAIDEEKARKEIEDED